MNHSPWGGGGGEGLLFVSKYTQSTRRIKRHDGLSCGNRCRVILLFITAGAIMEHFQSYCHLRTRRAWGRRKRGGGEEGIWGNPFNYSLRICSFLVDFDVFSPSFSPQLFISNNSNNNNTEKDINYSKPKKK